MKTLKFILSIDFEPTPDADEIERFIEQVADLLDDLHQWDFCGSVEIGELTLIKPDRRKGRNVRGSYDRKT